MSAAAGLLCWLVVICLDYPLHCSDDSNFAPATTTTWASVTAITTRGRSQASFAGVSMGVKRKSNDSTLDQLLNLKLFPHKPL